MVFGIVLGLWLLLMGAGTMLGRTAQKVRRPVELLVVGQVLVALVPICQVLALRTLRDAVFVRGGDVGVLGTTICAAVLLAPFCIVAGYTLVLASAVLARANDMSGAGRVYVADSIGCIAGGVLFSFFLVHWLDHIALLCVSAVLNLGVAMLTIRQQGSVLAQVGAPQRKLTRAVLVVIPPVALGVTMLFLAFDPDTFSTAIQFAGQRVLFKGNSAYGRVVVTEAAGQTNFIENGVVVVYTPNIEQVEETVHYAMCQRPDAHRVLLVSGSAAGVAREILKYNVGAVDCVELDPLLVELTRRFLPEHLADPRIHVVTTDARRFIRRTTNRYDVVIFALPDPTTAQLNRLFTVDFFDELKRVLSDGGVFSFALGRYENYVSPELGRVLASAYRTLKLAFQNVLLLPTSRVFFLASDGELDADIASRLAQAGVQVKLLRCNYLEAVLTPDRFADMERALAYPAAVNRDFSPVLYYYALRHWASQFETGIGPVQLLLLVVLLLYAVRVRRAAAVLFASGFAGSALEVVLLLAFQVLCGSVYYQVGVIVTLFMVGLAVGAAVSNRKCSALYAMANPAGSSSAVDVTVSGSSAQDAHQACYAHAIARGRQWLVLLALGICVLGAVLPFLLKWLVSVAQIDGGEVVVQGTIGLCVSLLGGLVGAQFPLANWIESGGTSAASKLFTADFIGAFMGALVVSTLLIPVFGVVTSCIATAGLNLAAAFAMWHAKTRS